MKLLIIRTVYITMSKGRSRHIWVRSLMKRMKKKDNALVSWKGSRKWIHAISTLQQHTKEGLKTTKGVVNVFEYILYQSHIKRRKTRLRPPLDRFYRLLVPSSVLWHSSKQTRASRSLERKIYLPSISHYPCYPWGVVATIP